MSVAYVFAAGEKGGMHDQVGRGCWSLSTRRKIRLLRPLCGVRKRCSIVWEAGPLAQLLELLVGLLLVLMVVVVAFPNPLPP